MTIVAWLFAWGALSCLVSPLIGGLMRFGLGDGKTADPTLARTAQVITLSNFKRRALRPGAPGHPSRRAGRGRGAGSAA